MNRSYAPFISLLALLSLVSGHLMSKATWISKVGITFFHKGYNFTKIWWQGAIAVFLIQMILFTTHYFVHIKLSTITGRLLQLFILLLVITGLYFTYDDFHTDWTHRSLGHRFHFGFYLIWIGWSLICLFFIFRKKEAPISQDRKETTSL